MIVATQAATALDVLVDALRAALTGVEVVDGQPLAADAPDLLIVGYSPDRVALEITQRLTGLVGRSEKLNIVCLASALVGDTNARVARDRAVAIVSQVQECIGADPTFNGAFRTTMLGLEAALDQAQTGDGASATIEFSIEVMTA